MVSYKELGLVNTREMFKKAMEGKYAVPAYNFNNMEQIQAIILACLETQSPVILQVSSGARKYADQTLLQYMGQGAVAMMKEHAKEKGLKEIPIACMQLLRQKPPGRRPNGRRPQGRANMQILH